MSLINNGPSQSCIGCARTLRDIRVAQLQKEHNEELAQQLQKKGSGEQKKKYPKRHPTLPLYCKICPSRATAILPDSQRPKEQRNGDNPLKRPRQVRGGMVKGVKGTRARVTCVRCHLRPKADKSTHCRLCTAHYAHGDPFINEATGRIEGCMVNGCDLCAKYWKRQAWIKRNDELRSQGDPVDCEVHEVFDVLPPNDPLLEIESLLNAMGPDNTLKYMENHREFDVFQPWIGLRGEFFVFNTETKQETEIYYPGSSAYERVDESQVVHNVPSV